MNETTSYFLFPWMVLEASTSTASVVQTDNTVHDIGFENAGDVLQGLELLFLLLLITYLHTYLFTYLFTAVEISLEQIKQIRTNMYKRNNKKM